MANSTARTASASGKFDRELTNVLVIQDEISRGIVNSTKGERFRDDKVHRNMVIPNNSITCRRVKRCLIWQLELYAAFLRLAASRESTSATIPSITGWLKPFCLAISCTSISGRSI
jgi:hypothetical protein